MFSSSVARDAHSTIIGSQNQALAGAGGEPLNQQEILERRGLDDIILRPVLEYGSPLMNKRLIVRNNMNSNEHY